MPSFAIDVAGAVYSLETSAKFRRDLKRMAKQGRDLRRLARVVECLLRGEALPPANRDHALTGDYAGSRECHIAPDWLLVYKIIAGELILTLMRTGSHAELGLG